MPSPTSNRSRLVSQGFSAKPPCVATNSQRQREAAVALSDYSNEDVFAWLKLVRSARNIEPIPEPCSGGADLSPAQIQALVTLKDCPNNRVEAYLILARRDQDHGSINAAFAASPFFDPGLGNNSSSFLRPSNPSFVETGVRKESSQQEHPSSPEFKPYGQRQFATNGLDPFGQHALRSANLSLSTPGQNHHWCTVCENPKSYKEESWKKHEKEHETRFVCKLESAAHESMADQAPCTTAFSTKRRDIMVNHLNKSHGFAAQEGRVLADQWRFTVEKQAWSCGFCGSFFPDFKDRLKHIDTEHFKKYETMQQWDSNKVIHGLLLQPKMENAWRKRTASLSPCVQPEDLFWTKAFAKYMRPKLEIGPSDESDANRLADEVYSARIWKGSLNEGAINPTTDFPTGMIGAGSLISPNQYQTVTAPPSESAPDQSQRRSTMYATANIYGDPPFDQSPRNADDHWKRAASSLAPLEEGHQGTYNTQSFYPIQDWAAESEGGNGYSGFDEALGEVNQGFSWSTSDWNGQ